MIETQTSNSSHIKHFPNWSFSLGGLPIELFSNTDIKKDQITIALVGGIHGDEPEGVWLAEHTLNWFKQNERHNSNRQTPNWFLIPCLNPDGFQKGERTNKNGVDLNRNFPTQNWSKEFKSPRYNPGPHPASEAETQALMKALTHFKPDIIIHFHSWKPCIVLTGTKAKEMALELTKSSQYPFLSDIGYPTPGSLGEYGWAELQIPVICIEVEEGLSRDKIWPLFESSLAKILAGEISIK